MLRVCVCIYFFFDFFFFSILSFSLFYIFMWKVHSIKFTEYNNGTEPENNPTKLLLFVNRNNIGFEDVEDFDPTTTLELTAADLKHNADSVLLKFVNYQRVNSITIFVEDNNGGDITALGGLTFFGKTVATTNMKEFKKQGWG